MLVVGQELWWVPSNLRASDPHCVKVTKVGRKWATLDNWERIEMTTLHADGGQFTSPGRCWLSQAEYEAERDRQKLWSEFRIMTRDMWRAPDGVLADEIRHMIAVIQAE